MLVESQTFALSVTISCVRCSIRESFLSVNRFFFRTVSAAPRESSIDSSSFDLVPQSLCLVCFVIGRCIGGSLTLSSGTVQCCRTEVECVLLQEGVSLVDSDGEDVPVAPEARYISPAHICTFVCNLSLTGTARCRHPSKACHPLTLGVQDIST